ncbi:YABBY protein [Musa troglodytarum]|uniref:YABBY protein n=1 Tax=Musa troglodytarum TaxID=320322 RepID=A0A9E7FHP8_9LILI|nr:YABBY protein [Musa troglodytarum]
MSTERVCYVHCNFCNSILVVNIPWDNLLDSVRVRCECCSSLLRVSSGVQFQKLPPQDIQLNFGEQPQNHNVGSQGLHMDCGSSSMCANTKPMNSMSSVQQQMLQIHRKSAAEKRQRVPSAYNRFIKEEIRRLKATNPDISHKEAFSTAAKNVSRSFCCKVTELH